MGGCRNQPEENLYKVAEVKKFYTPALRGRIIAKQNSKVNLCVRSISHGLTIGYILLLPKR